MSTSRAFSPLQSGWCVHLDGLTFMWDLRLSFRAHRKGHRGHWWLFKPVWMTMCLFQ